MTVTDLQDLQAIKQEFVVFLRNQDIFSVSTRGVTTVTEEFDGDGSTKAFQVSHSNMKNVRSVTVDGVAKTEFTDYTVDYDSYTINFVSAPGAGTNNVDVQYDYGSDKIFGDWPRTDLTISSYPRMSVAITSWKTEELEIGGAATINDYLITIFVWDDNIDDIDDYIKSIRKAVLENKKNFHYLKYVTPVSVSPVGHDPDRAEKISHRSLDCRALFNIEVVS